MLKSLCNKCQRRTVAATSSSSKHSGSRSSSSTQACQDKYPEEQQEQTQNRRRQLLDLKKHKQRILLARQRRQQLLGAHVCCCYSTTKCNSNLDSRPRNLRMGTPALTRQTCGEEHRQRGDTSQDLQCLAAGGCVCALLKMDLRPGRHERRLQRMQPSLKIKHTR